jgi:hypothetical protein
MGLSYEWLYLSLYLWVLPAYVACICLLLFQCESMHLQMYLYVYVLYICFCKSSVCIYILIACSAKNLCGIAQLGVGYVTVCSAERMKVFSRVAWPDMGGRGCYIEPIQTGHSHIQQKEYVDPWPKKSRIGLSKSKTPMYQQPDYVEPSTQVLNVFKDNT